MTQRVVLAYSGGLDTSVAIGWIAESTGAEVICVAADVGQHPGQQQGQPGQQQYGPPSQPFQSPYQPGGPSSQPFQSPYQQQPGGYPTGPAPRKKGSALPWVLLVIGLVVIAGGVVAALFFTGTLGKTTFDNNAVQQGVATILTDNYGIKNVTAVSCPAGQEVKAGATFDCTATIDNQQRTVTITIKTDDGEYEVSQPK